MLLTLLKQGINKNLVGSITAAFVSWSRGTTACLLNAGWDTVADPRGRFGDQGHYPDHTGGVSITCLTPKFLQQQDGLLLLNWLTFFSGKGRGGGMSRSVEK